jgi:hypothetical protein
MNDPKKKRRKPQENFADFRAWLSTLDMINPTLHVNGAAHPIAALTVDFGTPLTEQKLSSEQSGELVTRMRAATRTLYQDKEITIRVQSDPMTGIWWASVG